jgi:hypothetical protein
MERGKTTKGRRMIEWSNEDNWLEQVQDIDRKKWLDTGQCSQSLLLL